MIGDYAGEGNIYVIERMTLKSSGKYSRYTSCNGIA
jgi:hypothetical protein